MKMLKELFALSLIVLLGSCMSDTASKETEKDDDNTIKIEINGDNINISEEDEKDLKNAINKSKDALKDLFNGENNGEESEVVNFRELKELLPNRIGSLRMEDSEGQTSKILGFRVSTVKGKYRDDQSNMEINIIDAGDATAVVNLMATWNSVEIDSESGDGYQKTTEYEGYKAFEEYDSKDRSGTFAVVIKSRIIVTISGDDIEMDDLKDAIEDINVRKIERMIA